MKKTVLILALLLLASIAFAQAKKYDVNFKNISMKEFVTFVGSFANVNIVYNEADLRGTVSVSSQSAMTASALMEIFYATLRANGLYAVKEKGYIQILADKDFMGYNEDFVGSTPPKGEEFVTAIITLQNYNAAPLLTALTRVKSRNGTADLLKGLNGFVVRDFGSRIQKMREICRLMDSLSLSFNLYSISLQNIAASKMEQHLTKMFGELLAKQNVGAYPPVILSDDLSNVLIVAATEDDYKKIQYVVSQIDIKSLSEGTMPRVFYIKYAQAEDLEKVLNKLFGGGGTAAAAGIPPGTRPMMQVSNAKTQVSSDKSTNSIIALGDSEFYLNLERMIEKLDIPRKQVYVEALILETSLDADSSFGVEWFGAGASSDGNPFAFGNSSQSGSLGGLIGQMNSGNVNLSSLPGGFSAGLIGNVVTYNGVKFPTISAFLTAVRTDNAVNIVSNPQILTLDNEPAEVFVGENRPVVSSEKFDANNNPIQSYTYQDVGIRLKVVPHIVGQDVVNLELEQDVNKVAAVSAASSNPITLKRTTKAKVQLYNKTIMVVSGLMKDDSSSGSTGIPLLSRIPLLGWLFKSETSASEKTNLMVFITAHIIDTREDMAELMQRRAQTGNINKDSTVSIPMQQEVESYFIELTETEEPNAAEAPAKVADTPETPKAAPFPMEGSNEPLTLPAPFEEAGGEIPPILLEEENSTDY